MLIDSGTGTNKQAGVDDENHLMVASITRAKMAAVSRLHGQAYAWTAYVDWGADKNALWLRNDSDIKILFIEKINIYVPAAAVVEIWVGSGNTVGGTVVTGLNLNRASNNVANASCRHTNTNVDAGAGMSLLQTVLYAANTPNPLNFSEALLLGRNSEVAINIVTDVSTTAITIFGYFHE